MTTTKEWTLREGSGCLFRGDKAKNPKSPDWKGDCLIGGKAFEIALWEKQGARGPFFSMSIKPKQQHKDPGSYVPPAKPSTPVQAELPPGVAEDQDIVPF